MLVLLVELPCRMPTPPGLRFRTDERVAPKRLRQLYDAHHRDRSPEVDAFLKGLRLRPSLTGVLRPFELANLRLTKHTEATFAAQAYHQGAPVEDLDLVELGELEIATHPRVLAAFAIPAMPLPEIVALFGEPEDALRQVQKIASLSSSRGARAVLASPFVYGALEAATALVRGLRDDEPNPAWTAAYEVWCPAPPPVRYLYGVRTWGGRVANPRYDGVVSPYAAQPTTLDQLRTLAEAPVRGVGHPARGSPTTVELADRRLDIERGSDR